MKHKKFLLIAVLLVAVLTLSGCSTPTGEINPNDGWFQAILVYPIAELMYRSAAIFNYSFAVGILITTIIVRTAAWPIYAKSNDLTVKLNLAQPEMNRIQAKYVTRKDPESQQKMQQELMGVYKKYGINFWGCLMPFLQMPIFISMYQVVQRITHAEGPYSELKLGFLGGTLDAAGMNGDVLGIILAIIVGATMYLLQKISMQKPKYAKNIPAKAVDSQAEQMQKTMKYMNYFMVGMMVFISLQNNALALYWVVGNIYSVGQTVFNRKLSEKRYHKLKQEDVLG